MKGIKEQLDQTLSTKAQEYFQIMFIPSFQLKYSSQEGYGDFNTTIAFSLAKILKKPPMEIAKEIAHQIEQDCLIHRVEVIQPGYINLYLNQNWKLEILKGLQGGRLGLSLSEKLQSTSEVTNEIQYILKRIQWVLEVFQGEGFQLKPIDNFEAFHLPQELELLDLMIQIFISLEGDEVEKINEALPQLANSFLKLQEGLLLRELPIDRLNGVLNLFQGIKGLIQALGFDIFNSPKG